MSQRVAAKMLNSPRGSVLSRSASPLRPMNRDFQLRFTAGLLILLTTATVVLAWINFQKEPEFQIPYDGVSWMEHNGSLFADRVEASGPGARAGIKQGDQLVAVNEHEVKAAPGLIRQLYRVGPWSKATYSLLRQSVPLDTTVILIPADRSLNSWLRLIALIYLGIGIYVLLRRWTAPGSTHFYIFCLVSFVFYAFKYTGKLNDFDWTIYWVNVTAWLLQPALFLHFVLTFPEKRQFVSKHQWSIPLVYFPGLVLLIRQILAIRLVQASESLRWSLDRTQMAYLATYFIAAAVVLLYSYRRASTPILRQQLKWVTRGTILAVVPFTLFYVIPYLTGAMPTTAMKVSVLSLGLLPLTFGYAIFRYRLMDLDQMLSSVVDRLCRTLLVQHVAVFLSADAPQHFVLAKSLGLTRTSGLNLEFLSAPRPEMEAGHLFFENTHLVPRETPSAQETIAKLDLNYYIPCRARQKTIAFLGLGKTAEGDFLSSEDVELLETLAGYLGIAIQNARLYASLEQKAVEYERLKDFNENIVESINVGVLAVDLADRIESWNSQMEVMYALPRWQSLTRPLSEVFPASFVEEFYRVRQNPGIHNLYKFRLDTPTGEIRTVNVAIAPLVTRKFNVIGRLIIMDDITERVELEAQLSQSDKLSSIGLLAAGVAHEVNTPLAVMSSYPQVPTKQLQGDPQRGALLEKITRQTFRASEIVNNLLNFSRTSGAEFTDVDVNKIIHDTLALLEHQFNTAKIRVEDELSDSLPLINGNPGRLQQVFLNLFLNARDAMPTGGTLRVATSNGDGVSVMVSDTGSGIAQDHIHRIYDPFFTTKSAPR